MGSYPSSTLGFERETNPYLGLSRARFIETLLASSPPRPAYYSRMKQLNSDGPPVLDRLLGQQALKVATVTRLIDQGHRLLDLRTPSKFGSGHIPGSVSMGLGNDLSNWAGWLLLPDQPLILVTDDRGQVDAAVRALIRVGLDQIAGYLEGGIEAWKQAELPIERTPQVPVAELYSRLEEAEQPPRVLDVRSSQEWREGHIRGAQHVVLGDLLQSLDGVPPGPLAVVCGVGYRSSIACSLLQAAGRDLISNVAGGMAHWKRARLPLVQEAEGAETGAAERPAEVAEAPTAAD